MESKPYSGWLTYGSTPASDRHSSLAQINRSNVQRLRLAWRYETGDRGDPETTPIIIGATLYAYTSDLHVIALDARTGILRWEFDPGIGGSGPSRGVTYWSDGHESRLFAGVMHFLFALDPETGKPIEGFGHHGRVDLRQDLRGEGSRYFVTLTSPGVVYRDLIIVGFRTSEVKPAPPGDIRAFDVHTGQLRWRFRTIPAPNEPGAETWPPRAREQSGAANNWAGLSLDSARGILYVPTGSAVNDFYGADRLGDDLYADTLLALNAATGRLLWYRQLVHHDILDRDIPSAPSLVTIHRKGRRINVLAQPTKQGYLFVFDRLTGRPIFPVRELPAPTSDVPGEHAAPTQPATSLPEPFSRQRLTEELLTRRTQEAHEWAVRQFRRMRSDGPFTPAGVDRPSVVFPGFDGGAEWGGAAVDPHSGVLYINANDVAWFAQLAPGNHALGPGAALYENLCSSCHGPDRRGSPPAFPSLIDLDHRLAPAGIESVIHTGRGRMPPFSELRGKDLSALVEYVRTGREAAPSKIEGSADATAALPFPLIDPSASFRFTGYKKFLDPDGYPAVAPPWGTLSAIDLNTGRYIWRVPLGQYPELVARGLPNTGSENYGGPIVTAGGLVFIGATIYDRKLRAFDSSTGALLWQTDLPYAGTATPATYMCAGTQYIVIATNSARDRRAPRGSAYVAYSLH